MYSILAGLMISLGCIVYLQVGGVAGALLFSLGLISILTFGFNLFTGKAGLLATKEMTWLRLGGIWVGNFIGTGLAALAIRLTPLGIKIGEAATAITNVRLANGWLANIILGIGCGMLMYLAVSLSKKNGSPLYAIMPVGIFILSGFNHCVADMFYFSVAKASLNVWQTIIFTTAGNIIGCNLLPLSIKLNEIIKNGVFAKK